MGDRANIVMSFKPVPQDVKRLAEVLPGTIVLYGHWMGSETGALLAHALDSGRGRWSDPSYLARIIVSQVVGDGWGDETGFGLSPGELGDNEHPVLVVDIPSKRVLRFGVGYLSPESADDAEPMDSWSFDEFAGMTPEQAALAHLGEDE